jgi:hypothetical protein
MLTRDHPFVANLAVAKGLLRFYRADRSGGYRPHRRDGESKALSEARVHVKAVSKAQFSGKFFADHERSGLARL